MPPRPPLFITDLDGTLLTSQKTVTLRTQAVLTAAKDVGIRSAVASARPFRLVQAVLGDVIGLFDAIIVSNGAAILDPRTGVTLNETLLSRAETQLMIQRLTEYWPLAGFGWEAGNHFGNDAQLLAMASGGGILRDASPERTSVYPMAGIHQLVMAVPDATPRSIIQVSADLLGPSYTVTDSNGGVIEISSSSVTKADGARWWAQSLGQDLSQAMAFGDEHNDIPLLAMVGHGIAMANATEEVKAAAAAVTQSDDDDGVARVLETLIGRLDHKGASQWS